MPWDDSGCDYDDVSIGSSQIKSLRKEVRHAREQNRYIRPDFGDQQVAIGA